MATISGTWFFNETLKAPDAVLGSDKVILENVSFGTRLANYTMYENYNRMRVDETEGSSALYYGDIKVYDYETETWPDGAHRRIDFGDKEQTVSKDFYDWFTDNAEEWKCVKVSGALPDGNPIYLIGGSGNTLRLKCRGKVFKSDIRIDARANAVFHGGVWSSSYYNGQIPPGKTKLLKCAGTKGRNTIDIFDGKVVYVRGRYVLKDGISNPIHASLDFIESYVTFAVGVREVIRVSYDSMSSIDGKYLMYEDSTGDVFKAYVYEADGDYEKYGWATSNYMDFGNTDVAVPLSFYNWLISNTKTIED
jgi:hypothetical protein